MLKISCHLHRTRWFTAADILQLHAVKILASMANFIEGYVTVIPINNGHSET